MARLLRPVWMETIGGQYFLCTSKWFSSCLVNHFQKSWKFSWNHYQKIAKNLKPKTWVNQICEYRIKEIGLFQTPRFETSWIKFSNCDNNFLLLFENIILKNKQTMQKCISYCSCNILQSLAMAFSRWVLAWSSLIQLWI